jgi:hypothetical protein
VPAGRAKGDVDPISHVPAGRGGRAHFQGPRWIIIEPLVLLRFREVLAVFGFSASRPEPRNRGTAELRKRGTAQLRNCENAEPRNCGTAKTRNRGARGRRDYCEEHAYCFAHFEKIALCVQNARMVVAISLETRRRIVSMRYEHRPLRHIRNDLKVSARSSRRLWAAFLCDGEVFDAKLPTGRVRSMSAGDDSALAAMLVTDASLYLDELADSLSERLGKRISIWQISTSLKVHWSLFVLLFV